MKLITLRSQVLGVVDRWKEQYPKAKGDKLGILRKLEALDLKKAIPEDLEHIIGNSSWACPTKCRECNKYFDVAVEVGEPPDWESATTQLCHNCIKSALELFDHEAQENNLGR